MVPAEHQLPDSISPAWCEFRDDLRHPLRSAVGRRRFPVWPEKQVISSRLGYEILNLNCMGDDNGGIFLSWQLVRGETAHGITYAKVRCRQVIYCSVKWVIIWNDGHISRKSQCAQRWFWGIFVVDPMSNGAFGGISVRPAYQPQWGSTLGKRD